MGKIIATDLDGTLFYPKDKNEMIYKPNLFFLQSFIDDGGKVILISGRSYKYCLRVINKIGRPCQAISYNGACIYDGKKTIFSNVIPNDEAKSIIDDIFKTYRNPGVFLMTEKGLFIHLIYKSWIIRKGFELYYKGQKIYAEDLIIGEDKYNEELLANPRNAAAGSVRQLDSKVAASRKLDCFIYHLPNPNDYGIKTHYEALKFMKDLGFVVNPNIELVEDVEGVLKYIDKWTLNRESLPYEIDGIVIKTNDFKCKKY